jgi:hypothetical protein
MTDRVSSQHAIYLPEMAVVSFLEECLKNKKYFKLIDESQMLSFLMAALFSSLLPSYFRRACCCCSNHDKMQQA